MAKIAVDALGGDRAPDEVVAGALEAAAEGIEVMLFGPAGLATGGLPLVEAADRIEMADKPAEAVRAKPDSSLVAADANYPFTVEAVSPTGRVYRIAVHRTRNRYVWAGSFVGWLLLGWVLQ